MLVWGQNEMLFVIAADIVAAEATYDGQVIVTDRKGWTRQMAVYPTLQEAQDALASLAARLPACEAYNGKPPAGDFVFPPAQVGGDGNE